MRRGWIKRPSEIEAERENQAPEPLYLMWDDEGGVGSHKTGAGLTRIAAPKLDLPGNEESYNPPQEYLPSEAEKAAHAAMDEEERPSLLPCAYGSLREVPAYPRFIHERFERCLDLYLCPRVRRKRMQVSKPDDLLPAAIPKPSSLKPYPNRLCITYEGHTSKVRASPEHSSCNASHSPCVLRMACFVVTE
jgi:ribosome biogenesis protein ERB1